MRQNGEPSVEEILQSIKHVIARDNRTGAQFERQRRRTFGMGAGVIEDERVVDESITEDAAEDDDVLELGETAQVEAEAVEHDAEPALIGDRVCNSMRESLAALAVLSEPRMPPQIVRSGETSLEGLTRELLRPALAEWLDKNLPPMVERLVAAEIARIVGKKG
ncbi:DUF2497 domain-containing protein [Novosphingobium album (ex Hu et al. 2023)]|uniref:DUF2497 domain-containing protein n=1 Tax=Novosphingobium album (ex Hu et al. 2023) TaxID=2930093 RepID=A0ABT0B4S3_9SPHN|nr:DUF2497 domain-containing protein [Novosphingobium album (ex Hu et al. 2023)]MCJ2179895.1 DUF2497 domain-containing protein [Novosphingobium album (ex Hu et al. 2023)]